MPKSKRHLKRRETKVKKMKREPVMRIAANLLPGITPNSLKPVKCKCGGVTFSPMFAVMMASPLQTVNGQPTMVQFPMGYVCVTCKKPNDFEKEVLDDPEVSKPEAGGGDLGVSVSEKVKSGEALG